jgi:hypothetical protein
MSDDWEIAGDCPKCNSEMRSTSCYAFCQDGYFDGYEEDPLWYDPGDLIPCRECNATGYLVWCPECGWDETFQVMRTTQEEPK